MFPNETSSDLISVSYTCLSEAQDKLWQQFSLEEDDKDSVFPRSSWVCLRGLLSRSTWLGAKIKPLLRQTHLKEIQEV